MKNVTRGIVKKPARCSVSSLLQICGYVKSVSCFLFLLKHLQKLKSYTQEYCEGMLWRTGLGAQGSEEQKQSKARAVLLLLLLDHPVGLAVERSHRRPQRVSLSRIKHGQGWTGLPFPFKEATKGRKPLTQAESWRMWGAEQSDWCCSRPRICLPAMGVWDAEEKLVLPYKTEHVVSKKRKENHNTPFVRGETVHRAGCPQGGPTPSRGS